MSTTTMPTIHFAHAAYNLTERFALRTTGHNHFQTYTRESLAQRMGEAEVLVISGFWDNALIPKGTRLKYIHACAVGYDQFDQGALEAAGVQLTNSSGVNANAVSEHAYALILGLLRQIHVARDNQRKHVWRGMISQIDQREDELPGKTMLIYGLGTIGQRIARIANAFGVRTIGLKRDLSVGADAVDELHASADFKALLPQADIVVLACPLTDQTRNVVDAQALGLMKDSSYLINVARGGCVDQNALIEALKTKQIAGAGIDVTTPEPLDESSELWTFDNVILSPHTGGETQKYEDNVLNILVENLQRLERGEELRNLIV
jgi:phosphoglycerate dehydrogenase-like enzyme